jgi:hypothetical protein
MNRERKQIASAGFADLTADDEVMLEITYRMKKRNVTAESYVEVPVSGRKAKAIAGTADRDYPAVRRFLEHYIVLQDYDALVGFSVNFALILC